MTAALDRFPASRADVRPPAVLFAALAAADEHIRRDEKLEWEATWSPPITSFAQCVCGSTFEVRDNGGQITDVTDDETLAAAEAVAEVFGRALLDVDLAVVTRVIDKINHERASAQWEARRDWDDAHAYCGDDL